MLKGKKILVGVTGSIAAYKSAMLIRRFIERGAEVKVIATALAKQFITPLTLATPVQEPGARRVFRPGERSVELAREPRNVGRCLRDSPGYGQYHCQDGFRRGG